MERIHNLFVSSESRNKNVDPYGNNYTVILADPIKNVNRVELLHASVPNSIYNLPATSGGYAAVLTTGGTLYYVAPGFYGGTLLAKELTKALSSESITVEYITAEGKFVFLKSSTFTIDLYSEDVALLLGFNDTTQKTAIQASTVSQVANNSRYSGNHFVKSDKVALLNQVYGIFLDIKELRSPYNITAAAANQEASGLTGLNPAWSFGMIPLDVVSGDIKRFNQENNYPFGIDYKAPIGSLGKLTVQWVDINGQRTSFNGSERNSFLLKIFSNNNQEIITI